MKRNYYFGEKLQELRKENNLSQEALAEILDVSRQSVSKWESGKIYPEIDKLIFISNYFNISIDELIKEPPNSEQENIEEDIMPQPQMQSERKFINISKPNSFKEPPEQDIMPSGYEIPPVQSSADTPIINNVQYVSGNNPKKKINRKKRWLRIIAAACFSAAAISFTITAVYMHATNRYNYDPIEVANEVDDIAVWNGDDFEYLDDFYGIDADAWDGISDVIDASDYIEYDKYSILEKVYYYYDAEQGRYLSVLVPIMPCDEGSGLYGLGFSTLFLPDRGIYVNIVYIKDDLYPPDAMQYMLYYSEKLGKYMNVIVPPNCSRIEKNGYKVVDVYDSHGNTHKMIVKDSD